MDLQKVLHFLRRTSAKPHPEDAIAGQLAAGKLLEPARAEVLVTSPSTSVPQVLESSARLPVLVPAAPGSPFLLGPGVHQGSAMLNLAVAAMLQRLQAFLPLTGPPPPSVTIVSLGEESAGLGGWRGLGFQDNFPIALKGVRIRSTVRFQLWNTQPELAQADAAGLIDQLLSQKDALASEGFLDMRLKDTSFVEHAPVVPAWRQAADFEILYEFHYQDTDGSGGLIARIPAEFRDGFGTDLMSGDVAVWNEEGAETLRLNGSTSVEGLATLSLLPGAVPPGTVTITRTFQGAFGAPVAFGTLADFLNATSGPSPDERHASVEFASLTGFLNEVGAEGDAIEFLDEADVPRDFRPRKRAFTPPIVLKSKVDRLEVAFGGSALAASQILYLRGLRGSTNPS